MLATPTLLVEYRRRTGDHDNVELIDAKQRETDLQFCHHDACTGSRDGKEAEYTIEGTPYCDGHTEAYLLAAVIPYRKLEELMARASAEGLTVQLIDDGRIDSMRRCQSCHHRATYTVEREEYCIQHLIALLEELL